jgi:uncharacterized protein with HEPN domain
LPLDGTVSLDQLGIRERIPASQEQIEAFCRKWKIRELDSVVREDSTPPGGFRVRVKFEEDADHSLLEHVRLEREAGVVFRAEVRVIEKDALGYPLNGAVEDEANVDLGYVQLMRVALEQMVLHVIGLQGDTFGNIRSLQDSTIRQLIVVSEAAARVSDEFRSAHPAVPWADLAGLRSVLVQPYDRVPSARVWRTIARDCPQIGIALDRIAGVDTQPGAIYDVSAPLSKWNLSRDPGYR